MPYNPGRRPAQHSYPQDQYKNSLPIPLCSANSPTRPPHHVPPPPGGRVVPLSPQHTTQSLRGPKSVFVVAHRQHRGEGQGALRALLWCTGPPPRQGCPLQVPSRPRGWACKAYPAATAHSPTLALPALHPVRSKVRCQAPTQSQCALDLRKCDRQALEGLRACDPHGCAARRARSRHY